MGTRDRLLAVADVCGWTVKGDRDNGLALTFTRRGRGYLDVGFDVLDRVTYVSGARRLDGTKPYPHPSRDKSVTAELILTGGIK